MEGLCTSLPQGHVVSFAQFLFRLIPSPGLFGLHEHRIRGAGYRPGCGLRSSTLLLIRYKQASWARRCRHLPNLYLIRNPVVWLNTAMQF